MAALAMGSISIAQAQRIIKGTVYMDGKPGAGVMVEAHKGGSMMTGFDGKYEVEADAKTKWLKFTFIDETKKLDIEGKEGDIFDFAFTGELPSADGKSEDGTKVNLSSLDELVKAQDKEFLNELSLYTEFYKQKDYSSAFPHWKKLYTSYPKSTVNLYIHGAKMYEKMIEQEQDADKRNKLIDDYMKLYDKRIKYFGEKGYVLGRKGTAWLKYKLEANGSNSPEDDQLKGIYKSAYEWLNESISLQGNETEPPVLVLYMQTTVALFKLGELPKEQVVANYEKTMEIANAIVAESQDADKIKQTQETVIPFIDSAFGKSGAADCDALVNIYSEEFKNKQDDADFIKSMLRRLGRAGCTESELFAQGTVRLYELDPSAEAAFNMARRFIKKGDSENAKKYYKMAMEQETDQDLLATYYYEYALFIFAKEHAYQEARAYARKALAINPNYCDAYMLIGNIYVAASQKFEGTALEKSAIFWLAVDYFNKARKYEDCAVEAAESASKYRKYFPNKEEAFMEGLQAGSTYKVEGWINETTKVRF